MAEHVVGERIGELVVARKPASGRRHAAPRAEMQLVDRDRGVARDRRRPLAGPPAVLPVVAQVGDARRRRRWFERRRGDRVGALEAPSVGRRDAEAVAMADLGTGGIPRPHAGCGQSFESDRLLPAMEVADDVDATGVWRPYGEPAAAVVGVGTEHVEDPPMRPLVEQVEVQLARRAGDVHCVPRPRVVSVRRWRRTAGSASVSDVGRHKRRRQIVGSTLPGMLCGVVSPTRSSRSALTR